VTILIDGGRMKRNDNILADEAQRWISDYENHEAGTLFDWNKDTIEQFKDTPLETLLYDDYFLGLKGKLYDSVYQDLIDLWDEREKRTVNLAVFLEAIGAGKSFKASVILWLLWYEMCMYENPQKHFGLVDRSIICIMLLSRTETQSRRVVFTYCWERFQSGFNKDYFPANPRYSREVRIDRNNTCVYAGTSSALSALGYNVYSAVIDEANFLEVTEDSKKTDDDMYDAGEEMYNAVMNRMTSRFMKRGHIPGIVVLISSPRFPDSFLERKIKEFKAIGVSKLNAFWRSRSLWEAKGPKYFDMDKYFEVDIDSLQIINEKK
jgi:hypothetical protein